ncbi:Nif11-like leader peptide family natural product precursor [Nostoc sp. KVJ3]|uniref:Nif11-like leader peptide family natural product precursor n=1 Tax=Nostoc sp. KVJ3 TaxID=457945 RepID=UPI002237F7C8|nr:Nif11-like leader peptide family natural product precursor [Nostoc sp. KVJ3]MCW5315513.1 Nif11-like leader peptide family natural product precursor [Nostoc sp. KVJ3]
MSIQSAKALYTRLLVDEEFRTQLEQAASQEERGQILQNTGFYYTPDELKIAKAELLESAATNDELSETEQEEIIAGRSYRPIYSYIFDRFDVYLT